MCLKSRQPELDRETQSRAEESPRGLRGKSPLPREALGTKAEATPRTNSGRPNAPTAAEEQTLPSARSVIDHPPKQREAVDQQNRNISQKTTTQPPPTTAVAAGINPKNSPTIAAEPLKPSTPTRPPKP
ncbi:hypothetical protein RHGRI_015550 [Rhododendron griersonianum]|uniref:Uncharacterized protein n=1 Tax=Rhododendron griersonianum TaxID=479676 RepID=A0AAV6KE97_9ERIC|nr:hypothetical protein RHGRI_015550 [Rhododendron griersonianum]